MHRRSHFIGGQCSLCVPSLPLCLLPDIHMLRLFVYFFVIHLGVFNLTIPSVKFCSFYFLSLNLYAKGKESLPRLWLMMPLRHVLGLSVCPFDCRMPLCVNVVCPGMYTRSSVFIPSIWQHFPKLFQ